MRSQFKYDVFISHAVEDKASIAHELSKALKKAGLKVWYSSEQLGVGGRVEKTIQEGMDQSRFGVVILSPVYLEKHWTLREYYYFLARESSAVLPIVHGVTIDQLKEKDISMADTFAISSALGIEVIANTLTSKIKEKTQKQKASAGRNSFVRFSKLLGLPAVLLISFLGYSLFMEDMPPDDLIRRSVEQRIKDLQIRINEDHLLEMSNAGAEVTSLEHIMGLAADFDNLDVQYRNKYEFNDGREQINFKKNVNAALNINAENLTALNAYGLPSPELYLYQDLSDAEKMESKFSLVNTLPTSYTIVGQELVQDSKYLVRVKYHNNLRYICVTLTFSEKSDWRKEKVTRLLGFLPQETYVFDRSEDTWIFAGLR